MVGVQYFLAEQLNLSQPGRKIMPTTVLWAPPDFQTKQRHCYGKFETAC